MYIYKDWHWDHFNLHEYLHSLTIECHGGTGRLVDVLPQYTRTFSHAYRLAVTITCPFCEERIAAADQTKDLNMRYHVECFIRMVAGSAKHQLRQCSCYGFPSEDEEPGLTKRHWARRAWQVHMALKLARPVIGRIVAATLRRQPVADTAYSV